jgi:hypothetical protein
MIIHTNKPSMRKIKSINIILILLGSIILNSCVDYKHVDEKHFLGTWELCGRDMYSDMTIKITEENNLMTGHVVSPPTSNEGQLFIKKNDIWITSINRSTDYYFELSEKKIANKLFSMYELDTSSIFYATFSEDNDRIFLHKKTPNTSNQKSDIYYKRVE